MTLKWKDYRRDGPERYNKVMTLDTPEFIRRFLMHVLNMARLGREAADRAKRDDAARVVERWNRAVAAGRDYVVVADDPRHDRRWDPVHNSPN